MSETSTETATFKPRPYAKVKAELDQAKQRHLKLQKVNEAQWQARQDALTLLHVAELSWKGNPMTKGIPFDNRLYPVPSADTPESVEYHKIHETITKLENELVAARKVEFGG
jgi:hypothetical protein